MKGRIIIVGGAGFLGTAIAKKLYCHGYSPLILDSAKRLVRNAVHLKDISTAVFDFTNTVDIEQHLSDAEGLIHLGCTTTPANSMASLKRDAAENIAPSVGLFEAAGRQGLRRVLFASSGGTVYGNAVSFPTPETAPLRPLSGYGVSKAAIEAYLHLIAKSYDFIGVSLRIGNPYGSFQLQGAPIGVIARYLNDIRAGHNLSVWGNGEIVRDYVFIDDLTEAVLLALNTPGIESGAYNVGSGQGYSINQIIDIISSVTGKCAEISYQPSRDFDVQKVILDIAKLSSATDWRPVVDLKTGIRYLWELD